VCGGRLGKFGALVSRGASDDLRSTVTAWADVEASDDRSVAEREWWDTRRWRIRPTKV
jgi:hypothetical protein